MGFKDFLMSLPEVAMPTEKKLSFKERLKWTLIPLAIFFVLGLIPLFGLGQNAMQQFEYLSIILGAEFGSIISLGIGPIVTASIVLQLLVGAKILKLDTHTTEGRKFFQGLSKGLALFFIIFEAAIYVFMGGLAPPTQYAGTTAFLSLQLLLILQLILGGILIMFLSEVSEKWGFISGISMFIAAGVSKSIFVRAFSPFKSPANPNISTGAIPALFQSLAGGDPTTAALELSAVIATVAVFAFSVYAQSLKIEIPLSFGRIRGQGIRWPLNFLYTSNIPVILVAALLANVQLWGTLFGWQNAGKLIEPTNIVGGIIKGSLTMSQIGISLLYILIMVGGSAVFAWFWMQTAGMDAKSQAKNIVSSGLQIPGFRKDERVLERLLDRYIKPLTIMGGMTVGLLAAIADLSGALSRGTGILLTVMIIYKLYEDVSKQYMMDMNPAMRKFMKA